MDATPAKGAPAGQGRPGWLGHLWRAARTLALAYLALVLLAWIFQRRLIYIPTGAPAAAPSRAREAGLREVELTASDGVVLKAWHWPGARPATLVVFHGNAGSREHRLSWAEALRRTGAGVFILDYRGYGGSGGSPSEEGLYRDGEAAAAYLEAQGLGPLVYVGESLGTGVAVELALRRPPAALVLQSPFTSLTDVAARHYPFLPVRLLLKDRFESLEKIAGVSCPVLVIHSAEDSLIPIAQGRKLFERAPGRKEFLEVPGCDHNDPLWDLLPGYAERVGRFLGM